MIEPPKGFFVKCFMYGGYWYWTVGAKVNSIYRGTYTYTSRRGYINLSGAKKAAWANTHFQVYNIVRGALKLWTSREGFVSAVLKVLRDDFEVVGDKVLVDTCWDMPGLLETAYQTLWGEQAIFYTDLEDRYLGLLGLSHELMNTTTTISLEDIKEVLLIMEGEKPSDS